MAELDRDRAYVGGRSRSRGGGGRGVGRAGFWGLFAVVAAAFVVETATDISLAGVAPAIRGTGSWLETTRTLGTAQLSSFPLQVPLVRFSPTRTKRSLPGASRSSRFLRSPLIVCSCFIASRLKQPTRWETQMRSSQPRTCHSRRRSLQRSTPEIATRLVIRRPSRSTPGHRGAHESLRSSSSSRICAGSSTTSARSGCRPACSRSRVR